MAVDDIKGVQEKAVLKRLAMQVGHYLRLFLELLNVGALVNTPSATSFSCVAHPRHRLIVFILYALRTLQVFFNLLT